MGRRKGEAEEGEEGWIGMMMIVMMMIWRRRRKEGEENE